MEKQKLKVMSVFGTRPDATKMAPLVRELEKYKEQIHSIVCVTAQHREMLDQVLQVFDMTPDYDLNVMQKGQTLSDVTIRALKGLEEVMSKEQPDLVLAHGDTTTAFVAGLAAYYQKVPVGHVEAGLRTGNKYEPYPEEMNRKLVCALADLHFAPTHLAKENLLKENVREDCIYVTGNTAIDCVKYSIQNSYPFEEEALRTIDFSKYRVITMTAHRRENIGEAFEQIFGAVQDLTEAYEDILFVYPLHRNPIVQETASRILKGNPRVLLTDALNMRDMHNLMNQSYLIMTDSGGLQEEAPALRKPVVVLRNVTERPEGLTAGTLTLGGTERQTIFQTVANLLDNRIVYDKMAQTKNPFGDGESSRRIVEAILYHFKRSDKPPEQY